jgi:hypothetical protein
MLSANLWGTDRRRRCMIGTRALPKLMPIPTCRFQSEHKSHALWPGLFEVRSALSTSKFSGSSAFSTNVCMIRFQRSKVNRHDPKLFVNCQNCSSLSGIRDPPGPVGRVFRPSHRSRRACGVGEARPGSVDRICSGNKKTKARFNVPQSWRGTPTRESNLATLFRAVSNCRSRDRRRAC